MFSISFDSLSLLILLRFWHQLSVGITHVGGGDDEADEAGPDSRHNPLEERLTAVFGGVLDMGGVYAALLQAVCVVIVLGGMKTSTIAVNSFSFAKVGGSGQRISPSSRLARGLGVDSSFC